MVPRQPPQENWGFSIKLFVSLAIAFQLVAILTEPLHFFSRSPSRGPSHAFRLLKAVMRPYIEFTYLNHGYFFFAPEVGPSHLLQCTLRLEDGSAATLRYPDKNAQWPRLCYHRHFMLAEFLNQMHVPPVDHQIGNQLPPEETAEWSKRRQLFESLRESMEGHLNWRFSATDAKLERVQHILPGTDLVLDQKLALTDPSLYFQLPDRPPTDDSSFATQGETTPNKLQQFNSIPPGYAPSPLMPRSVRGGERVELRP